MSTAAETAVAPPPIGGGWGLPIVLLLTLAVTIVPLFLRMPLTNDAETYDLQADIVRRGGILYRDALEPNLPGVVWVHLAVRSAFGESSEALKWFDLLVFCGVLALCTLLVRRAGGSARSACWTALALCAFYLLQSEWNHCQRDTWLLLPTLAAIAWRIQVCHRERPPATLQQFLNAVVEGLIWGAAVWLKPHVVFPAAAVWITSLARQWSGRRAAVEAAGLLCGGGLVGAAGMAWMVETGCWPYFVETLWHWNREYAAAAREHWTSDRFWAMALRFFPWFGLHLLALPCAAIWLIRQQTDPDGTSPAARAVVALVAAAYAGWLIQMFALQHLFDYVHAPGILLAILLLALLSVAGRVSLPPLQLAWATLAVVAAFWSPALNPARLKLWPICVRGPVTPALQDRLSHFRNPNRRDLERIAAFLQSEGVTGRDVCFYNSDFVGMYRQMGLLPPTRYTYLFELMRYLPSRHEQIRAELAATPHRFVVTDVLTTGIPAEKMEKLGPNGPLPGVKAQPKSWTSGYPWSLPAVFRSGTYLVHRVEGPIQALSVPLVPRKSSPQGSAVAQGEASASESSK
jgi:hypothetical protein